MGSHETTNNGWNQLDDAFVEGKGFFHAGDYSTAETMFRQILDAGAPNVRFNAKVAHALGLTLAKMRRPEEAYYAFDWAVSCDPSLERARIARDQLFATPTPRKRAAGASQHVTAPETTLPAPATRGGIVGYARKVSMHHEEDPLFGRMKNPRLRFRLETLDQHGKMITPTVELRGGRIVGAVDEGDLIELPGSWRPGRRPTWVLNRDGDEYVHSAVSLSRALQWAVMLAFFAYLAIVVF